MNTKIVKIDRDNPDFRILEQAAAIIRQGGLVAFPTETVYGLGANGLDSRAAAGIYAAKGRPSDNPLILHIAEPASLAKLAAEIPESAARLTETFWPGPLTVIVKRSPIVPDCITGGLATVAVRLPSVRAARDLIRLAGVPIAAPSANTSGRPSPTNAEAVAADLNGRVDMILDGGPCEVGVESSVVDCTTPVPTLLRPGGVTLEQLTEVLGVVEVDPALAGDSVIPRAPGMKYKHYAPNAPLQLVEAPFPASVEILCREVGQALQAGRKVGAVVSVETAGVIDPRAVISVYGSRGNKAEIAAGLYDALLRFDREAVDVIFAEGIDEAGLGLAVMNRLRKAAGYQILTR